MDSNASSDYLNYIQQKSYGLRSIFYLLTPNETYYERTQDVPDLDTEGGSVMMSFMILEQIIFLIKHGRFNGRINDAITSLGSVIIMSLPK